MISEVAMNDWFITEDGIRKEAFLKNNSMFYHNHDLKRNQCDGDIWIHNIEIGSLQDCDDETVCKIMRLNEAWTRE